MAAAAEAMSVTPTPAAASASRTGAVGTLSEAWTVEAKHEGCYTGGKVAWSQAIGSLACLCNEELHLVSLMGDAPARRVAEEADPVLTFALDPAGANACTSHRSGLLRHFRLGEPPALVRSWKGHDQVIADVCFDASGNFVATGSVDKSAKVFDFSGYFCTHSFRGHTSFVSLVRFHPSRLQLITVADTEVRMWDLKTSQCMGIMKDHLTSISSISFGKIKAGHYQLISAGRDQVVNVWQTEDKCALVRSIPVFEKVEGVAAVPTQGLLHACAEKALRKEPFAKWLRAEDKPPPYVIVTVGDRSEVRVWNPANGQCVATLGSPHAAKGALRQVLCVDEDGRQIVTIGEDMNLVLWSLPEFKVSKYIMGHNEEIVHVQLLPKIKWEGDSSSKGPAVSADRFVCIANDEHPRVVNCKGFGAALLRGHTDLVISCDVSADGQWIATGGKDQSIRIWSAESCRCACLLSGHTGSVSALSFTKRRPKGPKGAAAAEAQPVWLVSGGQDKTMKLWELPSPKQLAAACAGDGKELNIPKSNVAVIAHTKEVNDVLVSPNNKCIASAGQDKLVRVWSFPELKLLGECKGHRKAVWCVAFSPIDQVIASASGDGTVRLWNLRDYSPIRAFQGHTGAVLRVCFLANGMQMVSSGADGLLKLWQIRTADCAATFDEHSSKVWCIDVIGERMISGGADSKMCVWRDSTSEQAKQRHDEQAELKIKDTKIGLLVQEGKIEKALTLCLELDRQGQMRQILSNHTMDTISSRLGGTADDAAEAKEGSLNGATNADVNLRRWVSTLKSTHLEKFVGILEQWNSNRKMAPLAQMFLGILMVSVAPETLMAVEGMNAMCEGLLSYLSRHQARADALLQKTFVFDLVLQSSGMGLALMDDFGAPDRGADAARRAPDAGEAPGAGGHDPAGYAEAIKARARRAEDALKTTMDVLLAGTDTARIDDGDDSGDDDDSAEETLEVGTMQAEDDGGDEEVEAGSRRDGEAVAQPRPAHKPRRRAAAEGAAQADGPPASGAKRRRTAARAAAAVR